MAVMRRALISLVLAVGFCAGKAAASCASFCVLPVSASNMTNYPMYSTYEWSGYSSGQTEEINMSCTMANNSVTIIIKDGSGNAGIDPIGIYTSSGTDTIDETVYTATAPLMLNTPFQAITLQCDGAGNWMIQ